MKKNIAKNYVGRIVASMFCLVMLIYGQCSYAGIKIKNESKYNIRIYHLVWDSSQIDFSTSGKKEDSYRTCNINSRESVFYPYLIPHFVVPDEGDMGFWGTVPITLHIFGYETEGRERRYFLNPIVFNLGRLHVNDVTITVQDGEEDGELKFTFNHNQDLVGGTDGSLYSTRRRWTKG